MFYNFLTAEDAEVYAKYAEQEHYNFFISLRPLRTISASSAVNGFHSYLKAKENKI
jgi:hypothetical protein